MEQDLTYQAINDEVLGPMEPPRSRLYLLVMGLLAAMVGWAVFCWTYQVKAGLGVTGLNIPVAWAPYITNFVFWIGIGHAGTLISAILFLVRSRWRSAVSRSAEAMTVFAVITAGLFPLIHLGRLWVFYYIIPYPSQRQLWPDFLSPLVWDICAVTTYLTVSTIFWYVGLVPDLSAVRDRLARAGREGTARARRFAALSIGWVGAGTQWRHYGRGYLYFAALATPLVVSVHSVVSWDFAMSMLPGWHSTIFAPYFVAGAIHSGLAMVITLMIPMRRLLKLDRVIEMKHFDAAAQVMIVTALIVGYTYVIEPFMAWYSGDRFEGQFATLRATGSFAWGYWLLPTLNVAAPLLLLFRKVRQTVWSLLTIAILVNIGMWMERLVILSTSLSNDFLPHNWHYYVPRWPELSITAGSFAFFLFWFLGFARSAPTVAINDVKEDLTEGSDRYIELPPEEGPPPRSVRKANSGVLGVFASAEHLVEAVRNLRRSELDSYETYSPVRVRQAEAMMGARHNPVRYWTLAGAILGATGGFALAIGSALVNGLIAGGKQPISMVPYCVIGFEGLILTGALFNLGAVVGYARLGRRNVPRWYDTRFSCDRFGLFVACPAEQFQHARTLLGQAGAEEIRAFE